MTRKPSVLHQPIEVFKRRANKAQIEQLSSKSITEPAWPGEEAVSSTEQETTELIYNQSSHKTATTVC
jgi:hypothetical protein